jgi:hypothetical protein
MKNVFLVIYFLAAAESRSRARGWQAGCVGDDSLPKTYLIWAAIAKEFYILHYESGG